MNGQNAGARTLEYYLALKMKEVLTHAIRILVLDDVMSETRQARRTNVSLHSRHISEVPTVLGYYLLQSGYLDDVKTLALSLGAEGPGQRTHPPKHAPERKAQPQHGRSC
jgi:hypothetical protein